MPHAKGARDLDRGFRRQGGAMRILLEYCFDHRSSRKLYDHVAASLRRRGMETTVVQDADGMDVSSYDVLISHDFVDRRGSTKGQLASTAGEK
jgi:hypothetical protein